MKTHKTLYFFTATYPYGRAETFIEDEILYLSEVFEKIVFIPLAARNGVVRKTPINCVITTPIIKSRCKQYIKGLLLPLSLKLFLGDFFKNKVYTDKRRIKAWLIAYVLTNNLLASKYIRNVFKNISKEDVCYWYWGKGANTLSCFYKGKANFVSRFHGEWDLWEESNGGYAPLRQRIANSLDAAVFISEKGRCYFENKYSGCKTFFYPLGSADMGYRSHVKNEELRVVSCSTVYPLKRVPLIFDALKRIIGYRIRWTHIGGGADFGTLRRQVEETCPTNIKIELLGEMPHSDVMSFYSGHEFDVFVNVSTNEGVPVSIMEAISFDIPVVATNVGGNSEVVTSESGILVNSNPSAEEVAEAIVQLYNTDCHPRAFWEKHYSAKANYSSFANFLITI